MDNNIFSSVPETAILNIILKNPKLTDTIVNGLSVDMFSSIPNKYIFSSILDLLSQNLVPEYSLVVQILNANGLLDAVGGTEYLEYIYSQDYNYENFQEYKRLILDYFKYKELYKLSATIKNLIERKEPAGEILAKVSSISDKLNTSKVSIGPQSLASVVNDYKEILKSLVSSDKLPGLFTGYKGLNYITGGFPRGDLWIIGARPSQGKSAWVINSIINSCIKPVEDKVKTLLFSIEMKESQILNRVASIMSKIDSSKIKNGLLSKSEYETIISILESVKNSPLYIDVTANINIDYLVSTVRRYKREYDIDVVWIDYIQLMSERSNDATHELGRISRRLKLLAKELNIFIGIVAQLHRGVESRDDKRPVLSDIRQSGNLEEDADLVAFIYRDYYYNKETKDKNLLEFIIRKHREGPIGTVYFKFDAPTTEIIEK